MEFEYSKRTKMYMEQLTDFMNEHVYPNEQTFLDQLDRVATRWQLPPIMEELKAKASERGALEPLPARERARRRPDQSRVRAALRDHGPLARSRPRSSTARRPTPATWRSSCATAPRSRRSSGSSRCSTARSARPSR